MIPKEIVREINRIESNVKYKKERIEKLRRLEKLSKNADLISEYDAIIKQAELTVWTILESKDIQDAHKEQVILRSCAQNRLMAQGLKNNLCESQKQTDFLNESIEFDNRRIKELQGTKQTAVGII